MKHKIKNILKVNIFKIICTACSPKAVGKHNDEIAAAKAAGGTYLGPTPLSQLVNDKGAQIRREMCGLLSDHSCTHRFQQIWTHRLMSLPLFADSFNVWIYECIHIENFRKNF